MSRNASLGHRFSKPIRAMWGADPQERVLVLVLGPTWKNDLRYWDIITPEGDEVTTSAAELFTISGFAWRDLSREKKSKRIY